MADDAFICARCAALHPTCCRTTPEATGACFPLSAAERDRLLPYADALGVPAAGVEENTKEFLTLMRTLFPDKQDRLAALFPRGKTHMRLPLDARGACLFLRADGCVLPRDARPWYCQLFPVWVRSNRFDRFVSDACLVTHEARRLPDVFAALGMSREEAAALYRALCHDWGVENNDDQTHI